MTVVPSPFHSPESFGLTLIAFHDARSNPGEFDMVAIWQRADGAYLIGYDTRPLTSTPFGTDELDPTADLSVVHTLSDVANYARDVGFSEAAVTALLDGTALRESGTA